MEFTGLALDIAIGPAGDVWVGGEWRDLFRRADGRWERLVTPVPYHVEKIVPNGDGTAWILTSTRSKGAILFFESGALRVLFRGDEMGTVPASVSRDAIVVPVQGGLVRVFSAPNHRSERLVGFPGMVEGHVTLDGPGSSWVSRGALLERRVGDAVAWSGAAPFRIASIHDLRDAGTYVSDAEGGLWQVGTRSPPVTAVRSSVGPGFDRIEPRDWQPDETRVSDIEILRFGDEERLYVVDQTGANLFLRPEQIAAPVHQPARAWRTAAARLGIEGPRWNVSWSPVYDTEALVADLDGDGHDDLILFTMYDGIRTYRNVDDRYFIDWTREAGLRSEPLDDVMGGCLLDADGDGDLDVYVTNLLVGDHLFLNNGAAVFEDVTSTAGLDTGDGSQSAGCVDLDGDGDTDVAVATWGRGIVLQENRGVEPDGPVFAMHRLLADRAGPSGDEVLSTFNVNAIEAADLDHDGLPELFAAMQTGPSLLLRNRGAMDFEVDRDAFPGASWDRTRGAAFADVDDDGDLDLFTSGRGGILLWRFDGRRFLRPAGSEPTAPPRPPEQASGALVVGDVDDDGDIDVVWAVQNGPLVLERNRSNDRRSIVFDVVGPPENPRAVGAAVSLYRDGGAGDPARRVGWSYVGGSGPHGGGEVHFGGIPPGTRLDVVVRLPDGTRRVVQGIRAPFHGTIDILPGRGTRWSRAAGHRLRRLLGDPWAPRWAGLTAIGGLLLAAGVFALYRRSPAGFAAWSATAAGPVVSLVVYLVSPFDPGYPSILAASAIGTFGAGTLLAFVRSLMSHEPAPELLGELSFALRTFRHNQTPQRILERLRFDLDNLGDVPFPAGSQRAVLILEDLRAYREVVLPELHGLVRLADSAGLARSPGADALATQKRAVPALAAKLETSPAGTPVEPEAFAALRRSITDATSWFELLRTMTDRRLAVDLATAVRAWVASRHDSTLIPVTFIEGEPETPRVRFLVTDLHRVLDVLFENTARALDGEPQGRIDVRLERDGPCRVVLHFADNGPGIPEPVREAVFALGFKRGSDGEGYGLYYVRRTVERYGGSIAVKEAPGGGAMFEIGLDVVPPGAEESAA